MITQPDGQIYLLVPSHNRCELLCKTLAMIYEQLQAESIRVVVVDAGSTDGTSVFVKKLFPLVDVLQGNADMWWTASVNLGLSYIAKTAQIRDRIILMNDDINLAPEALLRILESSLLEPNALIGAVNILRHPGELDKVYFCGGHYDLLFARHKSNIMAGTIWQEPIFRYFDTDFLYGRLMLIPWLAIKSGCIFDDRSFPQYCADEDFSYSAKNNGFKVLIDSKSVVYVNDKTTRHFSLDLIGGNLADVLNSLTLFNSYYNFRQNWAFSKRYAKIPFVFIFSRYLALLVAENKKSFVALISRLFRK